MFYIFQHLTSKPTVLEVFHKNLGKLCIRAFLSVIFTMVVTLSFWFNNRSNIKFRLLLLLIVSVMLFLHKHIKTPDHNEAIRSCSKHEFFTFDYIDTCESIQPLETQLTIYHFSISTLKYKNLNSFSVVIITLRQYKLKSRPRSSRFTAVFE